MRQLLLAGTTTNITLPARSAMEMVGEGTYQVVSPANPRYLRPLAIVTHAGALIGPFDADVVVAIVAVRAISLFISDLQTNTISRDGLPILTPEQAAGLDDVRDINPSFLRWCLPGRDTSGGQFGDVGGKGNSATVEPGNTAAYTVDGAMGTTGGGTTGGIIQTLAASQVNLDADSLIMSVAFTRADPGSAESIFSWGASAGGSNAGFYFSHRSSPAGVGRIVCNRGNGTLISAADSAVKFSNAGGTLEVPALLAYDAPTRSVYLYRGGVLATANPGLMAGANEWTAYNITLAARLGGAGTAATTYAATWRGWQAYVFPGMGLPLNLGRVAATLAEAPSIPLRNADFTFAG